MPVASYRCEIDWDGDGDYLDTGEDVTARVRGGKGIKITRGRDQIRALAPPMAAKLALTLDNTSRDYSPENSGGPLYGSLLPGRSVQVWASRLLDSFDRADSALTLGSADIGGAWAVAVGTWGIAANKAYCVVGDGLAYIDAGDINMLLTCTINADMTAFDYSQACLAFRLVDSDDYLWIRPTLAGLQLLKTDGGAESTLATGATALSSFSDYAIEVRAIGNSIVVLLDGVSEITYTLAGGDATKYSGTTATQYGLRHRTDGGSYAARWDDFTVYTPLGFGRIDELIQHPEPGVRATEIKCLGRLAMLRGKHVSTQLYSSITTDVALGYILDAVGLTDTALRVFDTGKTTLDWWWLDNADAFDAAVSLVNTEGPGAALYEDGRGRFNFESRHYRSLTTRSLSSQATISDTGAEPLHSRPFKYDPGDKSIINVCTVTTKVRSAKGSAAVWSLGSGITLAADEVRKYPARQSDNAPFTAAIEPVSPTDYTVTAGSLASAILDRTSGASCTITLTAGASGATLSGLQLRAQTVSVDNATEMANTINTSASQTAYGAKTYTLPVRAEIPALDAQDFCNAVVQHYLAPRSMAVIALNNGEPERLAQILEREVSDLVTLVEAQTGISGDFWVERIEHQIGAGGAVHRCQFGCEQAGSDQYWVLGDAVYGLLGETTYLGY